MFSFCEKVLLFIPIFGCVKNFLLLILRREVKRRDLFMFDSLGMNGNFLLLWELFSERNGRINSR